MTDLVTPPSRVPFVDSDGVNNRTWTTWLFNLYECTKSILSGSSGGFLGLGIWRYRTATTPTPNSGQLQFDDTTIADATELYVHAVNDSGADMSAFLDLLNALDLIYIQVQVDASQFVPLA